MKYSLPMPSGVIVPYGGPVAPNGWLTPAGQTVSRVTYSSLFAALCPVIGTFTVTLATPGVFTLTAHGLQTGDQIYLTTTGALPTGLAANTLYYVERIDANTFYLATSRANAYAGTRIATSGSQSGTHTLNACPHGLGDGSTTFTLPDMRGRVPAGADNMGGTVASRLTNPSTTSGGVYGNFGAVGGEQAHVQTTNELASHGHSTTHNTYNLTSGSAGSYANLLSLSSFMGNQNLSIGVNNTGSSVAANVVQPTLVLNFIIKI